MADDVQTFFSTSGPLALSFPNYQVRQSQLEMSLMVERIFHTKGFNLIEAETGIGKSFAYLVPSIFKAHKDKQKIVISTHTIALQEQLFHKDLPFLLDLLGLDLDVVLVKGMNNYLCLEKLDKLKNEPLHFKNPHLIELESKKNNPLALDQAINTLPKDLLHKLSCDSLSCLSHTCTHFKNCHFFNARKPLESASIFIVNHHLLLTDLVIKNEGIEDAILPDVHHVIVDEAHHISDIAEELLAEELNVNSLEARLKPKALKEHLQILIKPFKTYHEEKILFFLETDIHILIDHALTELKNCFEIASSFLSADITWAILDPSFESIFTSFCEATTHVKNLSSSLEHVLKTAKELELHERYRASLFIIDKIKNEASSIIDTLNAFIEPKKDKILFFEKTSYSSYFKCHYLHASQKLSALFESRFLSTTFCSATLTFDLNFEAFKKACGLSPDKHKLHEARYFSDFDYKNAMLFAVPSDMPEPQHGFYEEKLFNFCSQVIKATQGGVFILFTSYDQLFKMADKIKKSPLLENIALFVQGTDAKQALLEGFKQGHNSVLLGTDSFWEGVDVQGDKLRCVIITKLPFRSPSDPIFQATSQKLREEKKDPFFEKALPEACIKFKQGLGRLIRSKQDYGCVICTDMRIINKNYGKFFLKTLPNCQKKLAPTQDIIIAVKEKMDKKSELFF